MGLSTAYEAWCYQIHHFGLSNGGDRYEVIAVDNRGAGLSDVPSSSFSILDMADDLFEVVQRERIPRFHLVGISVNNPDYIHTGRCKNFHMILTWPLSILLFRWGE
jgi:pimeloyl-ACP methyl ester carboxylesterase